MRAWVFSVAGLVGFLLVSYLLVTKALPLIAPFVVAALLAEVLNPLVERFERHRRLVRSAAVAISLFLFVGLATTLLALGIARVTAELASLINYAPDFFVKLMSQLDQLLGELHVRFPAVPATLPEILVQRWEAIESAARQLLNPGLTYSLNQARSLVTSGTWLVTNTLITLVATFFLSRDRHEISTFLLGLLPPQWRVGVGEVKEQVWTSTIRFAKAQALLILLTVFMSVTGLALSGARYALSIGILVGLTDLVPIVGPATIYLPWVFYHLLLPAGNPIFGIKVAVVYLVVAVVRQVLEPKLIGDSIGLHPLATLFAMYLGFKIFGAVGFLVGPLLAILLKAVIDSGLLPIFPEARTKK